ncbi:MAG TPA: ATP-dependent sacrificial sulfur transferase LarE, partial [Myxococcales bacterium]|nr:ATP-dependent sacrificial sulfur transferase LarE [Myxococcales bacterium]
ISASMAPEEQSEARALAEQIGVRLVEVRSKEIEDPRYAQNPVNRCYFCKTELYDLCVEQKLALGVSAILDGFNADDFKDHRPGHQAAREHQILSPLAEAGLGKDEIRAWSHRLGLPTWDKPQMACLASRIPYGTAVTPERLGQLAGAESDLRRLGLRTFRVRYHGEVARLEVAAEEQDRFFSAEFRVQVSQALQKRGFRFVSLDLEPFRSGRMNAGLSLPVVS